MKLYKSLLVTLLLSINIAGCGANGGVEPTVDTPVTAPATAPVTPIASPPVSAPTTTTAPATIIEPIGSTTDPTDDTNDVAADTLAPTVSVTNPLSASTDVALNQTLSATFSETMDAVTITTATFTLTGPGTTPVTGEVTYNLTSNIATFTPTTALTYNTLYTATITTGAEDLAGNALASNYVWSFTTATAPVTLAPTVSVTDPLSASTDVALNQTLSATFSETMDAVTITTATFTLTGPGTTPVTGEVTYNLTSNIATFTPTTALTYNTLYTATITTGAEDLAGNALASNYVWSFLTIPRDYTAWIDQGISYTALIGDAYYPSALYDATGFGVGGPSYALWYSNGINAMYRITSSDGFNWGLPTVMIGLAGKANHAQVLYDALCFGAIPCDATVAKYRMWFWDITAPLYSISAMATASSADGIIWTTLTSLTQDSLAQLVTGAGVGWNRGSYGPVSLFFSADALNLGSDPWDYSYVMYYDGTSGGQESTGLAYSTDGLFWHASASNPVLAPSGGVAWDANYAAIGTVLRDSLGLHFWYSGGVATSSEGIGYAFAADGDIFTKIAAPIFHISDGVSYRAGRVYTPSVIDDGTGTLKMYYSARATSGQKKIGMAVSAP